MSLPNFEIAYRENLWRVELSDFEGKRRLSVWAQYRDRHSGEWKPCGGKREAPGFFVEPDRVPELAAVLAAIASELSAAVAA